MDDKEKYIEQLISLLNMDNLPVIIADVDEHEDSLMDLAVECRRCVDKLPQKDKDLFDSDNENMIRTIAEKINLI